MQCYSYDSSCERPIFTTGPNIFQGTCMVEIGLQRLESYKNYTSDEIRKPGPSLRLGLI